VQYTKPDGVVTWEPMCIRAETEAAATVEATAASDRYTAAVRATRELTVVLTVEEP
jgi:hypothetical protein